MQTITVHALKKLLHYSKWTHTQEHEVLSHNERSIGAETVLEEVGIVRVTSIFEDLVITYECRYDIYKVKKMSMEFTAPSQYSGSGMFWSIKGACIVSEQKQVLSASALWDFFDEQAPKPFSEINQWAIIDH